MAQKPVTSIEIKVKETITACLQVDIEDISLTSSLVKLAQISDNLGGLKQELQEEFDLEFKTSWASIKTVGQLIDYIQKNAKEK